MPPDDDRLLALALRIADARGTADTAALDWAALSSSAADDDERAVVEQLQVLAGIAGTSDALQALAAEPVRAAPHGGAAGARWGHLALRECLGRGAFGAVWRAYDARLDTDVALKLIDDARAPGAGVIHEARLLARVRHPHVVSVHGAAVHDGRVGIWMELVRGGTLEERLRANGPLGAREAALAGLDVCGALAAVHAAGLVHRDVKAQNVMREDGGRIVLMDLGAGFDRAAPDLAAASSMSGTPLYMAPELFRGAPPAPAADLYALGVLLFRLVTGTFPVTGATVGALAAAHARGERTRLRDVRPDLPARFVEAVETATAADPAERPATAGALEALLRRALSDRPEEPARARRGIRFGLRLGPLQISFAASLVLALVVAGLVLRDGPRDTRTPKFDPGTAAALGGSGTGSRPRLSMLLATDLVARGDHSCTVTVHARPAVNVSVAWIEPGGALHVVLADAHAPPGVPLRVPIEGVFTDVLVVASAGPWQDHAPRADEDAARTLARWRATALRDPQALEVEVLKNPWARRRSTPR